MNLRIFYSYALSREILNFQTYIRLFSLVLTNNGLKNIKLYTDRNLLHKLGSNEKKENHPPDEFKLYSN